MVHGVPVRPRRTVIRFAVPPCPCWRGVFFNPPVAADPNFLWLIYYDAHRAQVWTAPSPAIAQDAVSREVGSHATT